MEPRIGLALGSGSARGLAHIGVLEVLREEGIPIHCIAGTSIGAVIGGLWASNGIEAYKKLLQNLNWWRVMGFFEPALSKSGIFGGSKLVNSLKELTHEPKIEHLRLRFVAVATDADTGQEVRLFRGDLVQGMRASFAIPGLFTPVRWDDRWLVDGGISAPVPIEAAKALGADRVIAINLNTRSGLHASATTGARHGEDTAPVALGIDDTIFMDAPMFHSAMEIDPMSSVDMVLPLEEMLAEGRGTDKPPQPDAGHALSEESAAGGEEWAAHLLRRHKGERPPGLAYTLARSIDWMQVRLAEFQLAQSAPDLVIEPQCGHVKLFDYDKSKEVIEAGRTATLAALPAIRAWL